MRSVFGLGLAVILIIMMVFNTFTPTEEYPTKEIMLDKVIENVDQNINSQFSRFQDMNFGTDHNMLGKSVYYFATEMKNGIYSTIYFGGAVEDAYPWFAENWQLCLVIIILILCSDLVSIILVILLALAIWIKELFFPNKIKKINGVWKNG